ncbi:MAG TPA: AAA family ATPase [Gaiellaceae bacterium]|jgi:DNA-binding CsgD family transcriptional regulator/tetratricopeptide (TPR) repeat protein
MTDNHGLVGRCAECGALDRLVAETRAGHSQVVVLRGDPGAGKSALLRYLSGRVDGWRVATAIGVESEMELAYSGLHQLCASMLDHLGRLPVPQRQALETVFGLSDGPAPDPFFVGLATLTLWADIGEERPLLCIVDDAHWLDQASAQIIGFVGRRLLAERIAIVCAAPTGAGDSVLAGFPTVPIPGLSTSDARALLLGNVYGPLDAAVSDQIIAESHGNPLALLELPRTWRAADLAGGFALPDRHAVGSRIERSFAERLVQLPADSRLLVLTAAAEPLGDPVLLQRAATSLGIGPAAAHAAEDSGLLQVAGRVEFAHPLVRSAAYRSAGAEDRHRVHRALAAATDIRTDPDRHAWHRARATAAPDEGVATELERSAGRAQATGGIAAAAAFLERSSELTLDPGVRARRGLAAAEAKHQAGAPETALRLLAGVDADALDELQRARVDLLRGRIAFGSTHGRDAPPLLLAAAQRLEPHDSALARDTYLEAIVAALFVGRLAGDVSVVEVAEAARSARRPASRPSELLLQGFAAVITEGYEAGAPVLQRAVRAFRSDDLDPVDAIRWLWHATHAAHDLWDDESWEVLCTRHIDLARQVGALALLPLALSARIGLHLFAGELSIASSLVEETAAVTEATGISLPPYGALALAAWRGRETEAAELIRAAHTELGPRGEGMGLTLVEHATAVLYNGLGRYGEACEAAQRGAAYPAELAFSNWSLVQLVEAAARSDRPELAREALQRLVKTTGPSGTHWARGVEARSRALVGDDDTAEGLYREAIEHLGRTRVPMELARAHLLYGEWLRRKGRRLDAREQLRIALEMFTAMGTEAFAGRAERELVATGEHARRRVVETREDLTPQEAQIARLAAEGLSNPEIGARLFISARTVEWHLRKVFTKLGISSRRQLRDVVPDTRRAVARV